MERKRILQCAGILALIAFSFCVARLATNGARQNEVSQAPLPLPVSTGAHRMPMRLLAEVPVLPTGLIEAAIPPSPRRQKAEPAKAAHGSSAIKIAPAPPAARPLAIKVAPRRPSPRPTTIEAARKAPTSRPPIVLVPRSTVPKVVAEPSAEDRRETPFILRGITSSLPDSLAPTRVARNLVTRRKTELVTRTIEPAMRPVVPPTLPLTVSPLREAPKTSEVPGSNKLRAGINAAEQRPVDVPVATARKVAPPTKKLAVGQNAHRSTPAKKPSLGASRLVSKKLVAKPPVKAAPARVKDELVPTPATKDPTRSLAVDPQLPAPPKVSHLPNGRRSVPENLTAQKPARQPEEKPAAKPQVAEKVAAARPAVDKLAPAPVELAPAPVATRAAPAREKVAANSSDGGSLPHDAGKHAAADRVAQDPASRELASRPSPIDDTAAGAPEAMPLVKTPDGHSEAEPKFTTLPWNQPTRRNPELAAAVKRANAHVVRGYGLASRGALYAGRAECIAAIRIIAQAYDTHDGTRRYTKAAAAGLTALKEADDFVRQSQALRDVDVSRTIVPHTTSILKDGDTSDLSPVAAARCYYNYAQEQLSASVGQELCGSMALYAMGKVAVVDAKKGGPSAKSIDEAMTLYRAALIANPKNFRAANELGVLLAENGQFELARDLLIRSVSESPQITTWKNLAALHTRTGEPRLAERAKREALALRRTGHDVSPAPAVKWVDPSTFASTTSASDAMPVAGALPKQTQPTARPKPHTKKSPINVAKKSIADWLKVRR